MIQRSFEFGEISSSLYGGSNQPVYQAALRTCRNMIVMRHGGATNRPGFQFVAEVKDSSVQTTLLKFSFNSDYSYILEAGAGYFRFHRNGARVTVSPSAWSNATAYEIGDMVSSGGTNYYCILAHTNHVPPNATYWYAMPAGGILEIPTPYAAADCPRIQFEQTGDVVTLTHRSYAPYELKRYSTKWTLTPVSVAPWASAPTGGSGSAGAAGALTYAYVVTACKAGTYEETLPSSAISIASCAAPTTAAPNQLSWSSVSGAAEYNVYLDRDGNGVYYFVGVASSTSFNDPGFEPDTSLTPPVAQSMFSGAGDYPATVSTYQQRRLFASTDNEPEAVKASRVGGFNNFTISSPIQDDDAISFRLAGRQVSEVRHMVEAGDWCVLLTGAGEWILEGDQNDGVLKPTAINPRQRYYFGSSWVMPVVIGDVIVYVQARGSLVRDIRFASQQSDNRDLTLFSPHLVDGYKLTRVDYCQVPDSIVWAVRSDGTLLGLTYVREIKDSWGWHHHDTDGTFEDVAVIPETIPAPPGSGANGREEDYLYVIVKRTINGSTKRYIERMASRRFFDWRLDGYFLDSFLTYNGFNSAATTVTLSTAAGWTGSDLITVTANAASFTAGDVGKGITVWYVAADGTAYVTRIIVTTYTSTTVVKGTLDPGAMDPIPTQLRSTALNTWGKAVGSVTGLSHLEGKDVSILANGKVLSGTVSSGSVTLDGGVYDVIHVGLPIEADFETLDLDSPQDDTLRDKKKLIKAVDILVDHSRGIMAGPDEDHLTPYVPELGDALGLDVFDATAGQLRSQIVECNITSSWEKQGRLFVRQSDPLPLVILAVMPKGDLGS